MKSLFSQEGPEGRTDNTLRDAATVILIRTRSEEPYEILLMRRHRNQAFMAGAYVFPGGRLDDTDMDPGLAACVAALHAEETRRLLQEPNLTTATALGLFLAAIRETFEEAGVLLAYDASGKPVDLSYPEAAARFAAYRLELHERRLTLADLARREAIRYAPDLLIPYSHWITPEIEPRRFNTRFFLAQIPTGQIAIHDRMELTESRWMTPALAITEHKAGRIVLMPPTLKTIEELHTFSCAEHLVAAARSQLIYTIYAEAFRTADGFGIRLPRDPEYTLTDWKQPPCPGETTRIVMQKGIWKTLAV